MKITPILAIAFCLIAFPLVPSFYFANAQEPATQFQWIAGFLAETFEAGFALIETIVSILRSPVGIPLLVQLTVDGIRFAISWGFLGALVGSAVCGLVGIFFPIPIFSVLLNPPLGFMLGLIIGILLGFLRGVFGEGEIPEGMQPPDMETIKGWAETNPFENVSH